MSSTVLRTGEWRLTENTTGVIIWPPLALSTHPEAVAYRESRIDLTIQAPRCGLPYEMLRTAANISNESQRRAVLSAINSRVRSYISQLRSAGDNGTVQTHEGPLTVDRAAEAVMHARDEVVRYLKAAWYGVPKSDRVLALEAETQSIARENKIMLFCEFVHPDETRDAIAEIGLEALIKKIQCYMAHIDEAFSRRDLNMNQILDRIYDVRSAIFPLQEDQPPHATYPASHNLSTLIALAEIPKAFCSAWESAGSPHVEPLRSAYFDALIKAYARFGIDVETDELWRYFCDMLQDYANAWDVSQEFFLFMTGRSTEVTQINSPRKGPIDEWGASEWGDSPYYWERRFHV